jgi:hypothetical protein
MGRHFPVQGSFSFKRVGKIRTNGMAMGNSAEATKVIRFPMRAGLRPLIGFGYTRNS